MSYVNRNSSGGRTGIIAAVAVIHAAAIYALVTGMGVEVVRQIITNLPSQEYEERVPPEPEPAPEPPTTKPDESHVDVANPERPVLQQPGDLTFDLPPLTFPELAGPGVPDPAPPKPRATYKPVGPRPIGDPGAWATSNDYPTRDIRQGNEGRAQFLLRIDASGKVTGCRITQSSGFDSLDAATCLHVARRASFKPARAEHGQSVPGTFAGAIVWVIPR